MPPSSRPRGRPGDRLDPAPEPQNAFQFPRMPFSEIQEDMNVYNRPISKEAFRAPSPSDFKEVADFFIEEVYNKRPEDFGQPCFGCLDSVEYPELYEEAIPKLHFFRQCEKMFRDAKFDEFGIRDVHAPEKNRFHWQISALINFIKFRQTRLAVFEEITANADDLAEKERVNIEERTKFEQEIATIKEARAKDEPEVEAVREVVSDLSLKLSSLHKQQLELAEETREAKATLTKRTEYAAAMKVKRMSVAEEVDRLRMRVVSSPDRVKGEMDEMTETLATDKETVSSMERRCRTLKNRTAAIYKSGQDVDKAGSALEVLIAEQERVDGLKQEINQVMLKMKEREREIEENNAAKKHLERVLVSVQQKLTRVGDQGTDLDRQTREEDRALADKEAKCAAEEAEFKRIVDEKKEAFKAVQEEILAETTKFAAEVELFAKKQKKVYKKFSEYDSDLSGARDLISADNTKSFEAFKQTMK